VSLEDVFAEFPARLGPEVKFVGPEGRDAISSPPRIAWLPRSAALIPPKRIGGGPGDDGAVYTRQWDVVVEVWGEDLETTEDLADLLLATAQDLLSQHGFRGGQEVWDLGGVSGKGVVCRLTINVLAPVLRTIRPTRSITAIAATYRLDDTQV
jgi:hypothetical protein